MLQYLLPVWGHSRFAAAARDIGLPGHEARARGQPALTTGWWDEEPMRYPHALISYAHWTAPFTFPKDAYIFGDSGGFTLRSPTINLKIDPVDVLQWQASMCTVGCVLDLPPKGLKQRIWQHGMDITVKHTRRALPTYRRLREKGTDFRWFGVLHGNNEAEVREYHAAVSAVYPFTDPGEGWAIRPEPYVDIYATARSLRILKSLGIKRAHFLAATSQDVIAVLLALGPRAGLELVSYDSAYAVKSGFNRHVFVPAADGLTFTILSEEGPSRAGRDWLLHECPCRVCAYMRVRSEQVPRAEKELHADKFAGWWSSWLQFHDLHIQEQCTARQAELAVKDPEELLRRQLRSTHADQDYSTVLRIFEEDGHEPSGGAPSGGSHSLLSYL